MAVDALGNVVSDADPATLAGIDDFVVGLLGYEQRATQVLAAADAAPGHALVNTYAGILHMLGEHGNAGQDARPYLERARPAAALPRERALIDILAAWVDDELDDVERRLDALLDEWPCDLLALKLLHYHQFNRGDFPGMLRAALRSVPVARDVAQMHGMLAFGYEQCHLLDQAEAAAREALSLKADEPWAQHALAHVMLTQGRIDEGAAFLEQAAAGWQGLNSFMLTHLWWHLALFRLSQGREHDALAAYDAQVWSIAKDYSQDQVGAVSLLARLEFAGLDVAERWQDLADHLEARADDVVQPFLSVQYLYGLGRAGRPQADALLAAIEVRAGAVWQDVAAPLARGLLDLARGDPEAAVAPLDAAMPRLAEIGGSHAQRDLFEQALLQALIRSGRLTRAQQLLEVRRRHDPFDVPLNRLLADVYDRLQLLDLAQAARERVASRLAPACG